MRSLYHFFRLIRPLNLLVIVITMLVFQCYLTKCTWIDLFSFDFLLLLFSILLIASSGNIINDYFDVKADRVNKPELLIIDKYIKRRWAILFNWIFNTLAFIIAFYLSYKYDNWWILLLSFVAMNTLWFYSVYFKRTLFIGNIMIAFLTGLVPLYVLFFNHGVSFYGFEIVWAFSFYAFLFNLIRELIKDIADVRGDLLLASKTVPIVFGIKQAKFLALFLMLITISPLLVLVLFYSTIYQENLIILGLISGIILSGIIGIVILLFTASRKKYLLSANILKLSMFLGLLIPLFL